MNAKELIAEAIALPVESRASLTEALLESLNQPRQDIDEQWFAIAQQRLKEVKDDDVELISASDVFKKIQKRFE